MTTPATAREIVERLPMFVVACAHCPKPLSHDYGYAEKANLALAIVTQALDAAVRAERERCVSVAKEHANHARLMKDGLPDTDANWPERRTWEIRRNVAATIAAALRAPEAS